LFDEFLREHPDHLKAPRAAVMTGILNYRLGNYQDAISILRDPGLRLKDPVATLAVIRTLARSYAMLGEYNQTHSSYIQAAAHESNPAPDMDYNELGDLYQKASASTTDPVLRLAHREAAVEQWQYVIQTPGLSPSAKREVQAKIDAMAESLNMDAPVSAGNSVILPAQDTPAPEIVLPETIEIIEAEPVPEPAADVQSPRQEGVSP
jgi:tetratricopeptide (TPR) repeat protein